MSKQRLSLDEILRLPPHERFVRLRRRLPSRPADKTLEQWSIISNLMDKAIAEAILGDDCPPLQAKLFDSLVDGTHFTCRAPGRREFTWGSITLWLSGPSALSEEVLETRQIVLDSLRHLR